MKRILFLIAWVSLLSLSFLTVIQVTPFSLAISSPVILTNFLQRFTGLIIFIMLFVQIVLGVFMGKIQKKMGEWVLSFHTFEGVLVYILAFFHPLLYLLSGYFTGVGFDPYVAFVNVCLICKTPENYFLTLGRISFWLLSISVFAAIFRNATLWLRTNWKKLQALNYLTFLLVGLHGFLIGSDFKVLPFFAFAIAAYLIVLIITVIYELPRLHRDFKKWVNS